MRFLSTLALVALATSPLGAQSLDDVLAKHFEALCGKDKIAAVQSAKMVAKRVFARRVPATILWKRPDKVRMGSPSGHDRHSGAYDSKTAWMVMPFSADRPRR
jgi:hypothetical protein